MRTLGAVVEVIDVQVIEMCFTSSTGALEVASAIVKAHPRAVYRVFTDSDMEGNTSVLHVHVYRDEIDTVLGQPFIKDAHGAMMVTPGISS